VIEERTALQSLKKGVQKKGEKPTTASKGNLLKKKDAKKGGKRRESHRERAADGVISSGRKKKHKRGGSNQRREWYALVRKERRKIFSFEEKERDISRFRRGEVGFPPRRINRRGKTRGSCLSPFMQKKKKHRLITAPKIRTGLRERGKGPLAARR